MYTLEVGRKSAPLACPSQVGVLRSRSKQEWIFTVVEVLYFKYSTKYPMKSSLWQERTGNQCSYVFKDRCLRHSNSSCGSSISYGHPETTPSDRHKRRLKSALALCGPNWITRHRLDGLIEVVWSRSGEWVTSITARLAEHRDGTDNYRHSDRFQSNRDPLIFNLFNRF